MDTSILIDTTTAAEILGVQTNRAALAIIKRECVPITYGRRREAFVCRGDIDELAARRQRQGVRRGRRQRVAA